MPDGATSLLPPETHLPFSRVPRPPRGAKWHHRSSRVSTGPGNPPKLSSSAGQLQRKLTNTDSDATLAPLVLGMLKASYSSRAPSMLVCA